MKIKRIIAGALAFTMLAACFSGCSDTDESSESTSAESVEAVESEEEALPETEEEWLEAMIAKSLTSYGNVTKMQEKLTAAQSGEELNISYLGGSITEGVGAPNSDSCFAKLTYDYISEKFGTGDNVNYNNAGISGTPSTLGVLRLDRDVLAYDPDICFVEFAVNDGSESDYQSAYESILRTLIENDVAVVLVFARTKDGHTCQEYMQTQGEYYDLPMISYSDAILYMFDNDQMTWEDFSDDESHPNEYGHTLVAEMIENYFDSVMEQTAEEYTYPEESLTEIRQYGAHLYENTNLTPEDSGCWGTVTQISHFENGWRHPPTGENDAITFKFTARFVYLLYHEVAAEGTYGKIHIKITRDGELYDEYDFDPVSPSGWGNCQTSCIAMSATNCEYEIEISMAEGDEDKIFEILGFGYTIDE
ncbi:MAG: SGNH/GDSL hydrolase family protein [Ruminococcus sp.]|nr:SGNH/GDSL hydrolase family protein [Ruminococcus sp.]